MAFGESEQFSGVALQIGYDERYEIERARTLRVPYIPLKKELGLCHMVWGNHKSLPLKAVWRRDLGRTKLEGTSFEVVGNSGRNRPEPGEL